MKKILVLLLFVFTLTLATPAIGNIAYAEHEGTSHPETSIAPLKPAATQPAATKPAATKPAAKPAAAPLCPTDTTTPGPVDGQCTVKIANDPCPSNLVATGAKTPTGQAICKEGTVAQVMSKAQQEDFQKRLSVILAVQAFLNKLLWPILVMIGGLLDNSLLFGSGMESRLREIWIPIRNLVNIMFVIVLVGIALYNILGLGDEGGNYSLKSALPRIIIGLIAVNFSFLGMKVMLDAVTVLTTSIFSLPGQVSGELDKVVNSTDAQDKEVIRRFCLKLAGKKVNDKTSTAELVKDRELETKKVIAKRYDTTITAADTADAINAKMAKLSPEDKAKYDKDLQFANDNNFCAGTVLTPQGAAFLKQYSSRNAALAMALNMSNVVFYEDIEISTINIEKLFTNTLFSVALYLVYAVSFLALFIVLLARMVVMWIAVAVSPIFVIGLTLPFVKEQLSGFDELQTQFIQNLIAPITIGLSMTVGWIMLRGVQSLSRFDTGSSLNFGATSVGIPVEGLNTLQDLMVGVGVVAVVWVAVFAAANKTIASSATEMLKGGLQTAGTWLVKTPLKNLPGVPVQIPGEEGKTQVSMPQLAEAIRSMGETDYTDRRAFADKLMGGKSVPQMRHLKEATYQNDPKKARDLLKTHQSELERGDASALKEVATFAKTPSNALADMRGKELEYLKIMADESKSEGVRGEAAKKFFREPKMKDATALTPASAATAAAPVKDESEVSIKPDQQYGGAAISTYEASNPKVVDAIKMQTQAIVDRLKAGGTKEELKNIVGGYNVGGKKPTAAEIKTFMAGAKVGGNDAYAELIKKIPEAELKADLGDTSAAGAAPSATPATPPAEPEE